MSANFRRKAALMALLVAVSLISTACADSATSQSSGSTTASSSVSATSSVSTSVSISSEPVVIPTQPTEDAESTEDVFTEETTEPDSADTGFPTEDIPADSTTHAPDTTEPPSTTPPATTTQTTTQATTTTATTPATTAPQPAAPVVIPDVKTVSSPQTSAEVTDTAVLDYSNAALGYIAASYSGGSARAKLRIVCGDVTYDHDLAADGTTEYFPLSQGSGGYSVQIYEQVEGRSYTPVFAENVTFSAAISDEISMYLYPNKYVDFIKSSSCVKKAAELCAGKNGTIERLAAIFGYITDNVTYDYDLAATVKSGYIPKPDAVLAKGSGICFDYASLFAAMARSQDIPSRLVIGYAADNIYHAWNEVYTEETGWISAELLLSRSGYNLVDSTFYAGAADKAAMAEYITNDSNYSAVYRY